MHVLIEETQENARCPTPQTIGSSILFHSLDFFRICTTVLFLTDRYADQLFNEIGSYTERPTLDADHYPQTSAPIMLSSALMTVIVKLCNTYYAKKYNTYLAVQDYIYALFSSSILFFVGDLFSTSGYMPSIPVSEFALISLVGVLAMMAIFLKFTTPLSSDTMIASRNPQTNHRYFDEYIVTYSDVSKTERFMNAISSFGRITSLSTFFWVFNHEMNDGVAPLATWQKVILGLGAAGSGLFGAWTVTDHSRFYLIFLMSVVFLNAAAMGYAGIAALVCFFNCRQHDAAVVIAPGIVMGLLNGLFSALYIQYRFENTHVSNQNIENMVGNLAGKTASFFHRCRQCCKPDERTVEEMQKDELLEMV